MPQRQKQTTAIVTAAEAAGWRVMRSTRGWKLFSPDGTAIVTVHRTETDHRAYANTLARLRKAGLDLRSCDCS